jgi:WD40 repeat protein
MLAEHKDSVECITFCQNDAAPFAVSCGMDTTINIYNIKDLNLR